MYPRRRDLDEMEIIPDGDEGTDGPAGHSEANAQS